jgi:hypothetical protein
MRPLKVGYILPETEHRRGPDAVRWADLRALAQRAEAVGFATQTCVPTPPQFCLGRGHGAS